MRGQLQIDLFSEPHGRQVKASQALKWPNPVSSPGLSAACLCLSLFIEVLPSLVFSGDHTNLPPTSMVVAPWNPLLASPPKTSTERGLPEFSSFTFSPLISSDPQLQYHLNAGLSRTCFHPQILPLNCQLPQATPYLSSTSS